MHNFLILLIAAFLCGCSSTIPERYSAAPTRCLVQGVATGKGDAFNRFMFGQLVPGEPTGVTHVRIRSVDGGEVLWERGYHLGDRVWLQPGVHRLSVMCSTKYSWGAITAGADVDMDVQPGYSYFLAAGPLKGVSDTPHVEVTKKEAK
jgi:hypothetical protein